jgi:hypothetical protein
MRPGSSRSLEKDQFWRGHLDGQSTSGVSMRAYCRLNGLLDSSFRFWKRKIAERDGEAIGSPRRSQGSGLIAVEIMGEVSPPPRVSSTIEIECPGGPVVRVREDVSAEILQRVMRTCQQILREEIEDLVSPVGASLGRRSCGPSLERRVCFWRRNRPT